MAASGVPAGALAMDGGDPRLGSPAGMGTANDGIVTHHEIQKIHDPSVTFEEYLHYAAITRADLRYEKAPQEKQSMATRMSPWHRSGVVAAATTGTSDEKHDFGDKEFEGSPQRYHVSEEEYTTASRAVRTATWGAVFYLITTDILGPYSTAWVIPPQRARVPLADIHRQMGF